MLRTLAVALAAAFYATSLAGCGLSCEDACAKGVECGSFDASESADCIETCGALADDAWLTCMDQDECADVDACSL
jgi:hypothetical protein